MFKKYSIALFAIILTLFGCHKKNDCGDSGIPSAPMQLSVTPGDTFLDINWENINGADGYVVYVGDTGNNVAQSVLPFDALVSKVTNAITTASVATVKTNYYRASNLLNDRDYIVRVASKNSRGHSPLSRIVHGVPSRPKTVPAKPASMNTKAGDSVVELQWSMVSGAESYHIYQRVSGTGNFILIHNTTLASYVVTGLTNDTAYDFIVKAANNLGEGEASDIATDTPRKPTVAPNPPLDLTAIAGDSYVSLQWTPVSGTASYNIYISDSESGAYVASATTIASPYKVSGLINGKTYFFKIAGVNTAGTGALSQPPVSATPNAPVNVPVAVTGLGANGGDAKVDLFWDVSPDASSYRVYISETDSGPYTVIGNTSLTSYSVTGLVNDKVYRFKVSAVNSAGEGPQGAAVAASTKSPVTVPNAPAAVNVLAGNGSATISWDNVSGATSYTIYQGTSASGPFTATTVNSSPYTVTGLTNGQTYYFAVGANNSAGSGPMSAPIGVTPNIPVTVPSVPSWLAATGGDASASLVWNSSDGAVSYNIYQSDTETGTYVKVRSSANTSDIITGLTNNHTYWFKVTAQNEAGESAMSVSAQATPQAPVVVPPAPTSVNVLAGNNSATVSWDPSDGATSYTIYQGTSASGPFTAIVTVTSSPYTVTGLTNGQTYYFAVGANNSAGNGAMSSPVGVTPKSPVTVPPVPSGLAASGGNATVSLSWNASVGAVSYNIYQSDTETGTYIQVKNSATTSDNLTGLTNGQTYWFKVTALNEAGESSMSGPAQATPKAPIVAPSAPAAVNATAGDTSVSVSWQSVQGADIYNIYMGTSEGGVYTNTASTSVSPFVVTGLANGTTYWFKVSAQNIAGEGVQSSAASATPMAPVVPPAAPVWLSAVAGDGYADLTWSEPSGATGYNIYQSTSESGTYLKVAVASVSNTRISGLTNGQTYWFKVTAANIAGEGALSGSISVSPKSPVVAPVAPAGLNAVAGNAQVNLSWNGVTGADTYVVYESTDNINFTIAQTVSATNVTVQGLTNDQTYYFKVAGQNSAGIGAASNVASATPKAPVTPPPAPLISSAVAGNQSVTLVWSPVLGAVNYTVYISSNNGVTYTKHSDSPDTSEVITGLTNGTTYFFQITAVNSAGMESVRSQPLSATPVAPILKPATPLGLLAVAGDKQVSLTWTASVGALTYNVYQSSTQNGTYTQIATRNITAHTADNLANGTTYWFKVSAVNSAGESSLSGAVSGTPVAPIIIPSVPTGLVATPSDSTISLSWNTVLGATSYNVYITNASGSSYNLLNSVTSASYTVTGLTNGTTYYYAVTSVNVAGESGKSVTASAVPLSSVIPAPGDVKTQTGILGLTGIRVTWEPVTWNGGVSKADGYVIYMSSTGKNGAYSQIGEVGPNVTTYDKSGLTVLSTYWFKIKTKSGSSLSEFSEAKSATVILGL